MHPDFINFYLFFVIEYVVCSFYCRDISILDFNKVYIFFVFSETSLQSPTEKYLFINFIFPKDYNLLKMLHSAAKARWSNTQKSWYVSDNSANRERFVLDKKIVGKEVLLKIHPNNLAPFQTYQNQLLLKGFSQNTIRVYSLEFAQLLYTLRSFPVHELTREN